LQGVLAVTDDGGQEIVEFMGDDGRDGAVVARRWGFVELVLEIVQLLLERGELKLGRLERERNGIGVDGLVAHLERLYRPLGVSA